MAEYTSRMDTEPLGALGMDLVYNYDAVKGEDTCECSHRSFHTYALVSHKGQRRSWTLRLGLWA